MPDEVDHAIVGDAVASALDENRGGRKRRFGWRKKPKKETPSPTHCENGGAQLHGHYCAICGQAAVDYHRSFRHVDIAVLDSFLNWDSKCVRSIGLLLWRPGWLTNQFLEGRRVRFVHPLRLYLLVSIVFFLCARLIPVSEHQTVRHEDLPPEARARYEQKMAKLRAKKEVRPFLNFTDNSVAPSTPRASPTPAEATPASSEKEPVVPPPTATPSEAQIAVDEVMKELEAEKKKEAGPHIQFGPDKKRPKTPFEVWMEKRIKDQIGENGSKAKLFVETLRSNLSTMMLFCIPLFAFILKILYLRQKRFYIEHLVYSLNIHAFFYLAVILFILISIGLHMWIPGAPQVLLTLLMCALVFVQIFLSIQVVYRQGWFMSLFKFTLGSFVYLFVLGFGVAATAIATLLLP